VSQAGPSPEADGRGGRTLRFLAGQPVTVLSSLGEKKAEALRRWGVETILDLITTYPFRYIDRTRQVDVAELFARDAGTVGNGEPAGHGLADHGPAGDGEVVVLAQVQRVDVRRSGPRGRSGRARVELEVADRSGSLRIVFFNQPWRAGQLAVGTEALFSGKPTEYRGRRQMVNPVVDVVVESAAGVRGSAARTLRVIPVYPQSAKTGLTSAEIGTWVAEALDRSGQFADPLPGHWRRRLDLVTRTEAMRSIHAPASMGAWAPARRRLAFDELFRLQLSLVLRRRAMEADARAIRHVASVLDVTTPRGARRPGTGGHPPGPPSLVRRFLDGLPFEPTPAQRRALAAIVAELAGPRPMHRLLQGDVGSGKTVVAVAALLVAVQGGHQGALMAPTEVLAEQHAMAVRALVDGLTVPDGSRLGGERPVVVALLTNRTTAAERARLHTGLRGGDVDIVVGTHALLTDEVRFRSLGVVVIDEQHRFGVEQRAALREKGRRAPTGDGEPRPADGADPDLLVMTATPIPRTAAMILFGDLDMVVLDELPPGRTPVTTVWARTPLEEVAAWARVRDEVGAGNRAYVVCPLVEGSERVEARSAVEELTRLSARELAGVRLGLLHGQMPAADKESVMAAFRSGEVQVLVATTVVEVGVDVAQATVMVIEDAGHFGISQLHQLRGRVGRSNRPSWCYLLGEATTPGAVERLEALERTTDGFELAEIDLDLRGEGTILGARQKGRSDLKLAKLRRDAELLKAARQVAEDVIGPGGDLVGHPLMEDEVRLFLDPEDEEFLFKS